MITEAKFTRSNSQESNWTTRETVGKLVELQGQTVDLLSVLQSGIMPDHAHYGGEFYRPEEEPLALRDEFASIMLQPINGATYDRIFFEPII